MSSELDMAEIAQVFIDESLEGIGIMESGLLNLNLGAADPETMNSIFRAAHSIKGGGGTFGFTEISDFAHHVETLLDEMRQGQRDVTQDGVDLLLQSVDCLSDMIGGCADGPVDTSKSSELQAKLEAMLSNGETPSAANETDDNPSNETIEEIMGWDIGFKPSKDAFRSGYDPQDLLRELSGLDGTSISVTGTEQLNFEENSADDCWLGWDISIDTGVDRERLEEIFAWVEEGASVCYEPRLQVCEQATEISEPATAANDSSNDAKPETKKEVKEQPAAKTAAPAKKATAKASGGGSEGGSIRVNTDKIDALINLVGELVITQSMLSRFDREFEGEHVHALQEGLSQLTRNTRELQESVMAIRMLPISFAFSRFPRLVRDTSNALEKKVNLKLTGEGTEVDKTVLEKIGDPLVHLVRNSLDHGLETPEKRAQAGKPEVGVLELKAYHEGGNIIIEVIDDGAGINKDRVLAKARERGLVAQDEQLSDDRINNLIFMAGFSTVDEVSDLSGRGVGMDVVRRNISDLGGNVSVSSTTGVGSTFKITLPLTLAILDGQLVRVGKQSYIISLLSIVETIQRQSEHINEVVGQSEVFRLRENYLPILRLHELFGVEADSTDINEGLLVVVEANGQRLGIFVDDLLEQQQVVIKSLEANYQKTQGISGATILGDGTVALIIDVPGLIQLFYDRQREQSQAVALA
ncbi:MAG: chemotaxis protein CheA [Pseudomonadota bacterium]